MKDMSLASHLRQFFVWFWREKDRCRFCQLTRKAGWYGLVLWLVSLLFTRWLLWETQLPAVAVTVGWLASLAGATLIVFRRYLIYANTSALWLAASVGVWWWLELLVADVWLQRLLFGTWVTVSDLRWQTAGYALLPCVTIGSAVWRRLARSRRSFGTGVSL